MRLYRSYLLGFPGSPFDHPILNDHPSLSYHKKYVKNFEEGSLPAFLTTIEVDLEWICSILLLNSSSSLNIELELSKAHDLIVIICPNRLDAN